MVFPSRPFLIRLLIALQCVLAFGGPTAASMDQSVHAADASHQEAQLRHAADDGDHLAGGAHCCHLSAHMVGIPALAIPLPESRDSSLHSLGSHAYSYALVSRLLRPPKA